MPATDATWVIWDDPSVDWRAFDVVLIRPTWDYPLKLDAFLAWADRLDQSRLCNPAPVVRWNAHKSYLARAGRRGVPVVPTAGRRAADAANADAAWAEVVVKPAVGRAARRCAPADPSSELGELHLDDAPRAGDVLVQPYSLRSRRG